MSTPATPLSKFLQSVAAKTPTPGGGSVSAIAGALAAAMGEMVLNYSVTKKDLAAHKADLDLALVELQRARAMLLELCLEDQAAYQAMTDLRDVPKDSPQYQAAVATGIRVPLIIAGTGLAVLELAGTLAQKVNRYLISDWAICAELAMATVRCGLYNVRINLPAVANAAEREKIGAEADAMLRRATEAIQSATRRIADVA